MVDRFRNYFAAGVAGLLLFWSASLWADEPEAATVSPKVLKYHALLVKRPEPGFLFDRFYNTWLDEATIDTLEAFLVQQAQGSDDVGNRLLLAFFYAKKGDDVTALDQFRQALDRHPASAAAWYHKSLIEARTLNFERAVADLKRAREEKPDDKLAVQIEKELGKVLARNRQTAEALEVWRKLCEAHPADEELSEDLIELHLNEGLYKEAAALEQKLLERTKDEYLAVTRRLRLGDIYQRGGERLKALDTYTTALDAVGSESWLEREILSQIDQVFRREDDLTGLKKLYVELRQKYEKRLTVRRRYAQLLVETGEKDEALTAYREILKITPGERSTREEYLGVLLRFNDQPEAIKELRALMEQFPQDAELKFRLATIYQESKQAEPCAQAVEQFLSTSDGSEYAYLRAARLLERLEKKSSAAELYQKMAEKFADAPAVQEAYALFLYGTDHKPEALDRWRASAKSADVAQTLQVARTLSNHSENEAALEILEGRLSEIQREPLYLGQLVTTAMALKKFERAVPWAIERVQLADAAPDLESAIEQAATVIERSEQLESHLRRLEALEPRGIPDTCLLAELLERAGNSGKADEVLQHAAEKGDLLILSQQVRLHNQRREWGRAAEVTRKMLELPGGQKSLYMRRLVELYLRDERLDEGLKWIDDWKRLSPGSTIPWVTEAQILQRLGKTKEAIKTLRTATLKFEGDEDLRVRLAEFYSEIDKPLDAERIFWQLYEDTEDVTGKLRWVEQLASLAERRGATQQLVQDFEARAKSNRESIIPLLALAEVYRQADDFEGRRRALTTASQIKPDDLVLLQQIARIEEQNGNWQAAIAVLERAATMDKTLRVREQIGRLYLNYGELDKGYAILLELASGDQADPRAIESTADALCCNQDWERAADFLAPRLARHPADYRLRYLYAVALEEATRTEEAIRQFTLLLANQEEIATTKQRPVDPLAQTQSYRGLLRQLLPGEAAELVELQQYKYSAYQHRREGRGMMNLTVLAGGTGQHQSNIQYPSSVDMVRPLAIHHLTTLANSQEGAEQETTTKMLESQGVKYAHLIASADSDQQGSVAGIVTCLEKNPLDEGLLAYAVVSGINVNQKELRPYLPKAIEAFRKTRPQLAFLAALAAGSVRSSDEEHSEDSDTKESPATNHPELDIALELSTSIAEPSPLVTMSLFHVLGAQAHSEEGRVVLDDHYRKEFSRLLLKWYPKIAQNQMFGPWALSQAVQAIAQDKDPELIVNFLADEVARYQSAKGTTTSRQVQAMYGHSNPSKIIEPLSFPPSQLSDFPPTVLGILGSRGEMNRYGFDVSVLANLEESKDQLRTRLNGVKNPVLRILLANRVEMNDLIEETLQQLLAAPTPQLDSYLLAAGWAVKNEKPGEALRLLEKARFLPMNQGVRKWMDGAIVAAALADRDKTPKVDKDAADPETKPDAKGAVASIEMGKQAALRLRQLRLDMQQRNELVDALREFGLKEEADKLNAVATTSSGSSIRRGAAYLVAAQPVQRTPEDQIEKLLQEGKREVVVKRFAGELAGVVRNSLANQQRRWMRNNTRDVRQRIEAQGMSEEVLKSLEPGESTNPQRLVEYALACNMFDKGDMARSTLLRALELKPKDSQLRTEAILILATSDRKAAAALLPDLAKSALPSLGSALSEMISDHEYTFDQYLTVSELAVDLIKLPAAIDPQHSSWPENCLHYLGRNLYARGRSLPSLYQLVSKKQNQTAQLQEVSKRRRELHRAFCQQLLTSPTLARVGFRHLLAAAEAAGESLDEFVPIAEKLLLDEASAKPSPNSGHTVIQYIGNSREVRLKTPEEFLVHHGWQVQNWTTIDDKLLPELVGNKNRESRDRLTKISQLYRCDEADYLASATGLLGGLKKQTSQADVNTFSIVVDAWADRKLSVDLKPLVFKQVKEDANAQHYWGAPPYLPRYAEQIAQSKDQEKITVLIEDLAVFYLGPADKRNEFIKKNYDPHQIMSNTPNARIHVFQGMLNELCQHRAFLCPVLEHLEPYDSQAISRQVEYQVQSTINEVGEQGVDAAIELLEHSPWLADLERFRPLGFLNDNQQEQFPLEQLLSRDDAKKQFRQDLTQALEKDTTEPRPFGRRLVLACLNEAADSQAILEVVGGQLTAIQQLPEKRREQLAHLINKLLPGKVRDRKDLSENSQAGLAWVNSLQSSASQSVLQRLLAAKRFEDLGFEDWRSDEFVHQQFPGMIQSDPLVAAKAYHRFLELAHEVRKRGQFNGSYGDGTSLGGRYLVRSGENGVHNWNYYRFVNVLYRDYPEVMIEIDLNASNSLKEVAGFAINRANKGLRARNRTAENRAKKLLEQLGPDAETCSLTLLLPALYSRLEGETDLESCQKLMEWSQTELQTGKYPRAATDLNVIYAMLAAKKQRAQQQDASEDRLPIGEYHRYFQRLLADETLPINWRLYFAEFVAAEEHQRLPLEVAVDFAKLYVSALTKNVPMRGEQQSQFIQVLDSLRAESTCQETLRSWQDEWARRYLQAKVNRNGQTEEAIYQLSSSRALGNALRLYLALGEADRSRQLLNHYNAQICQLPRTIVTLLHGDQPAEAARLLRGNWRRLALGWDLIYREEFDQSDLAAKLQPMLEQLNRDDERFLARVVLASMPNPPQNPPAKQEPTAPSPRDERLSQLADELVKVEFKDVALKQLCMVLLGDSDVARPKIADQVAAAYDGKHLVVAFVAQNSSQIDRHWQFARCHLRNRLLAGDTSDLVDLLDRLSTSAGTEDYQFNRVVSPIVDCVIDTLKDPKHEPWSPESCQKVVAALQGLLKNRQYLWFHDFRNYETLIVSLLCHLDRAETWEDWRHTVSEHLQRELGNQGLSDDLWVFGLRLTGPATSENFDARADYFKRVIRFAVARKWLPQDDQRYRLRGQGDSNFLNVVVRLGFFTAEELKQHQEALFEGLEIKDEPTYFRAVWAHWLQVNQKYEESLEAWRAIAHLDPQAKEVPLREASNVLAQVECLKRLKRFEEGLELLKQLDDKNFEQGLQKSRNEYVSSLRRYVQEQQQEKEKSSETAPTPEKKIDQG